MSLSDAQIDRYSRQIITHGMNGAAQNRLLESSLAIVGDFTAVELAARYLIGAGVGRIFIDDSSADRRTVAALASLNPDSKVIANSKPRKVDLIFSAIASDGSREVVTKSLDLIAHSAAILARFDQPGIVAILPTPAPCARCADARILAPFRKIATNRNSLAMLAATEALMLLAGLSSRDSARIVAFDSVETSSREVSGDPRCACANRAAKTRDVD